MDAISVETLPKGLSAASTMTQSFWMSDGFAENVLFDVVFTDTML